MLLHEPNGALVTKHVVNDFLFMLQDDEVRSGHTTWKQSMIYLPSYSYWLIALLFGLNK